MNKIVLSFSILLISVFSNGQAYKGFVQYQKPLQSAAVIELPYPTIVVNALRIDYLSKKGKLRACDMKGFTTFRNTPILRNESVTADLNFKTECQSRKEKEVTVVSLLVMPNQSQINAANIHCLNRYGARNYLNDFETAIDAYNLNLIIKDQSDAIIKDQSDAIIKVEAKYKRLVNEGKDLKSQRTAIERKIADNKNEQQRQLKENRQSEE